MLNHLTYQGRLTRDPDMRQTQNGVAVVSFTVAWSEKYKETETKCFLDCTAWRNTAEFVSKYFAKGQEILVEGKLRTDSWEDKDTGAKRSSIKLDVDKVHFCGSKQGGTTSGTAEPHYSQPGTSDSGFSEVDDSESELPF